jgi:hypothetical protein
MFRGNYMGRDDTVFMKTRYGLEWGSNFVVGEIFLTRPDHFWGPPSLLYNGYRVFQRGKAAGTWRWPPTHHLAPRLKKQ